MSMRFGMLALIGLLGACAVSDRHTVGAGQCRFLVPRRVEQLPTYAISGADTGAQSVLLQLDAAVAGGVVSEPGEFRFIATCGREDPAPNAAQVLREFGILIPVSDQSAVDRQPGTALYRIYKDSARSSWVLANFDPTTASSALQGMRIVAQCHVLSSSARDAFSCVHTAQLGSVQIEYWFGPTDVGNLDRIDPFIFSILERVDQ